MNFEELQKTWQSQDTPAKMTVPVDLLLKEVRRNQQHFSAMIFWRDTREVGVCVLMTLLFLHWGMLWKWWSLYLLAVCCLEVGIFFLVDRFIQHRKQPAKNDPLRACIETSLLQVKHQIWLLKNVLWWYLLPILIGIMAVTGQTLWAHRNDGAASMIILGAVFTVTYGGTFGFVYWINQKAVGKTLEPRREELESLLTSLE
jgi:hypothetical protein